MNNPLRSNSWSYWPWGGARSYTNITTPYPEEVKKSITSKSYLKLLVWHFCNISPCIVTGVIMFLNISRHTFSTWFLNPHAASAFLATIQIVAKAHEAMITYGLVNIARQWIQGCLIRDGTLLGLLGAERSLANLGLLLSDEYRAAVSYSINGTFGGGKQDQRKIFFLVLFLSLACLLCSIAGPASAVLMIPRLDWFLAERVSPPRAPDTLFTPYPNIFVDSRVGNTSFDTTFFSFTNTIYEYWSNIADVAKSDNRTHRYTSGDIPIIVNTSTTWLRPLAVGANWTGATSFSSLMYQDLVPPSIVSVDHKSAPKYSGSEVKLVVDITGIESSTVCRQRVKQSCTLRPSIRNPTNASEWCYSAVTKETDEGQLETSQNLLLVTDYIAGYGNKSLPRVWMTEGSRMATNRKFTDTIVFVFEHQVKPGLLTVCSTSATLKSATATSTGKIFSADEFQLHDFLAYFDGNSIVYRPPRTLLYHENWLDFVHEEIPNKTSPVRGGRNITYPPRVESKATRNQVLKAWATSILNPNSYRIKFWLTLVPDENNQNEAAQVEAAVGGAYISMLLVIQQSDSQYSQGKENIKTPMYPEDLMFEPMVNYSACIGQPIKVHHQLYGYKFSSRIEYLCMGILILHLIIALLGLVRQCERGRVIRAWGSLPEYAVLCLGSKISPKGAINNTCAGICRAKTLNTFVKIGETTEDHLELRELGEEMNEVDLSKKYGFLGHGRKLKLD